MGDPNENPNLPGAVEAERTHIRLPSRLDWIEPTVEYLRQKAILCGACQENRAMKLTVALQEALNNSVVHGNLELGSELRELGDDSFARALAARAADPHFSSRMVEIMVDYDGDRCQWTLTDQGKGFDVNRLMERDPSAGANLEMASGRGILLMRSFLDECRYENGGRRVILAIHKSSGQEKRKRNRVSVQKPVRVARLERDGTVDWNAAQAGVAWNLSEEGMAILQSRLASGDQIVIGVEADGSSVFLPAEVRHCRKVSEDMVEIGCKFIRSQREQPAREQSPATDVLKEVGGLIRETKSRAEGHHERRAHVRVAYTERIGISGQGKGEPDWGFSRDLSKSGIAFIVTSPIQPTVVTISLPQKGLPPLRLRSQIVRCVKIMDGYYDVGARFLQVVRST